MANGKKDKALPKVGTTIEQFSFLEDYLDKKVNLKLVTGQTIAVTIKKISAYELLVEEGTRNGKPVPKLIFKHAVLSIEERLETT